MKGDMRADLVKAAKLVRSGLTYSEAAERLGLTRNSVAGACARAGVRVGLNEHRRNRMGENISLGKRAWWASLSKAQRQRHNAKAQEAARAAAHAGRRAA